MGKHSDFEHENIVYFDTVRWLTGVDNERETGCLISAIKQGRIGCTEVLR